MQQRYYDPVIGRFYSNDPVGVRDTHSFNRYAYANNNPYKYVDPFGLTAERTDSREREAAKREESCRRDPNCSYFKFPSNHAVDATWGQEPEDNEGNPANGSISCNLSCQTVATDWSAKWNLLAGSYYKSQTQTAYLEMGLIGIPFAAAVAADTGFLVSSNYIFRGLTPGMKYGNGSIFQIRPIGGKPIFRIDYHNNPSPSKLHLHFGNMDLHRPWYAPWRVY